ncbi:hypothetical protein QAD02_018221, partial [Eretmocerus hayati]
MSFTAFSPTRQSSAGSEDADADAETARAPSQCGGRASPSASPSDLYGSLKSVLVDQVGSRLLSPARNSSSRIPSPVRQVQIEQQQPVQTSQSKTGAIPKVGVSGGIRNQPGAVSNHRAPDQTHKVEHTHSDAITQRRCPFRRSFDEPQASVQKLKTETETKDIASSSGAIRKSDDSKNLVKKNKNGWSEKHIVRVSGDTSSDSSDDELVARLVPYNPSGASSDTTQNAQYSFPSDSSGSTARGTSKNSNTKHTTRPIATTTFNDTTTKTRTGESIGKTEQSVNTNATTISKTSTTSIASKSSENTQPSVQLHNKSVISTNSADSHTSELGSDSKVSKKVSSTTACDVSTKSHTSELDCDTKEIVQPNSATADSIKAESQIDEIGASGLSDQSPKSTNSTSETSRDAYERPVRSSPRHTRIESDDSFNVDEYAARFKNKNRRQSTPDFPKINIESSSDNLGQKELAGAHGGHSCSQSLRSSIPARRNSSTAEYAARFQTSDNTSQQSIGEDDNFSTDQYAARFAQRERPPRGDVSPRRSSRGECPIRPPYNEHLLRRPSRGDSTLLQSRQASNV